MDGLGVTGTWLSTGGRRHPAKSITEQEGGGLDSFPPGSPLLLGDPDDLSHQVHRRPKSVLPTRGHNTQPGRLRGSPREGTGPTASQAPPLQAQRKEGPSLPALSWVTWGGDFHSQDPWPWRLWQLREGNRVRHISDPVVAAPRWTRKKAGAWRSERSCRAHRRAQPGRGGAGTPSSQATRQVRSLRDRHPGVTEGGAGKGGWRAGRRGEVTARPAHVPQSCCPSCREAITQAGGCTGATPRRHPGVCAAGRGPRGRTAGRRVRAQGRQGHGEGTQATGFLPAWDRPLGPSALTVWCVLSPPQGPHPPGDPHSLPPKCQARPRCCLQGREIKRR